jgi:hypothetical protein
MNSNTRLVSRWLAAVAVAAVCLVAAPMASALPPVLPTITLQRSTAELSQNRYDLAATSVGTKAMFAGGSQQGPGPYTNVDVFDVATRQWSVAHLSVPRLSLAATTVGDIAIFAGGAPSYDLLGSLMAVDLYNNVTDTWTTAQLSQPRNQLAATSHGTKAYISGGQVAPSAGATGPVFSNVIDVYDAVTNAWSVMTMPRRRFAHSSVTIGDKILFAGGSEEGLGIVDIYDTTSGTWSTGQLSADRQNMAAAVVGGKAIFVGGDRSAQYRPEIDIYDAATNTWTTDTLPHPIGHMAATTFGSYALFGGGAYTQDYNDVYAYDSRSGEWLTVGGGLSQARFDFAAASVGQRAIFAGGYGSARIDMFIPEPTGAAMAWLAVVLVLCGGRTLRATPLRAGATLVGQI